ncbi:Trimethylguanosine synthase [Cytospora mali]|uniref:Trimethylguanosine synthase n=1 Tax=Cytospora mali TaxID=578113 RepID=A0A194VC91_CYTMA|nr:Trimethylguanosine synthase [Valsa mali var. pyri (nom. inval.)]
MPAQVDPAGSSAGKQPQYETHLARLAQTPGRPTDLMRPAGRLPLESECKHYYETYEMPDILQKYWYQRYNLWERYDEDVYMTDDAWFGVTAEPIAREIAEEMATKTSQRRHKPKVLIDLFAGAGGNTIQFALSGHWDRVIGIERDRPTLACAQHNAEVYGASGRITWVHANCFDFLHRLVDHPDTLDNTGRAFWDGGMDETPLGRGFEVFASPPWGGVGYEGAEVFDLEAMMEPYTLTEISAACRPMAHALFLPRNGDLAQLASLVPDGSDTKLDVVQYCIQGASKGLVAYYPAEDDEDHGSA